MMPSIEQLMAIREKEGESLKKLQGKLYEKRKKKKIKEDIRKIKSAKLRSLLGFDSKEVDRIGNNFKNAFKGSGKTLKGGLSMLGKGIIGTGEAANKYYSQPRRRK